MRILVACTLLVGLAACSSTQLSQTRSQIENFDLVAETRRAIEASNPYQPFASGAVHIVAEEHGELHTYSLTPCGGDHICGSNGQIGHVQYLDDFVAVAGAYPGRTFFLSPGGDGYLNWRGVNRDLAWN